MNKKNPEKSKLITSISLFAEDKKERHDLPLNVDVTWIGSLTH